VAALCYASRLSFEKEEHLGILSFSYCLLDVVQYICGRQIRNEAASRGYAKMDRKNELNVLMRLLVVNLLLALLQYKVASPS